MKPVNVVIAIVAAIVLAGGGFAAGMVYAAQSGQNTAATSGGTGATGATGTTGGRGQVVRQGGGPAGAQGGQVPITGRVLAVNDGSITVAAVERGQGQQAAGASPATTSQIVLVGSSTRMVKTTETDVRLADIKVNDQVTIVGTTDSAGLVSATAIVVGPINVLGALFGAQGGTGGGGRPGASPTPTKSP